MSNTSKIVELDDSNTCKLCENAIARYSCPRCNIPYCSLDCYRSEKHSQCSETFYKDCVLQQLTAEERDEEAEGRMLEMLERHRLEQEEDAVDSDDEEAALDLGERLAGIDLDDADKVWEKLTGDERQEFMAFLKSEDVAKYVVKWEPWWGFENVKKVQELHESKKYKEGCPVIEATKKFKEISSKPPADCVNYNLINILSAYAFTARYFNGDHYDFAKEAASCIISLSLCLKKQENYPDFETAIKSVEQEVINSDWIMADAENLNTMREDLDKILKGPEKEERKFYIMCALSDLLKLLRDACSQNTKKKAQNEFSKQFPEAEVTLVDTKKVRMTQRKVEYYLSFARDCLEL